MIGTDDNRLLRIRANGCHGKQQDLLACFGVWRARRGKDANDSFAIALR